MRTIVVDALYDDGSAHRPIAPQSGATTVRLNQGEDTALQVINWTPAGGRHAPKTGDTYTVIVKEDALAETSPALLTVLGVAQPDGSWLVTFTAAQLAELEARRYVFSGKLVEQIGPTTTYTIPLSTMILQPTAG